MLGEKIIWFDCQSVPKNCVVCLLKNLLNTSISSENVLGIWQSKDYFSHWPNFLFLKYLLLFHHETDFDNEDVSLIEKVYFRKMLRNWPDYGQISIVSSLKGSSIKCVGGLHWLAKDIFLNPFPITFLNPTTLTTVICYTQCCG